MRVAELVRGVLSSEIDSGEFAELTQAIAEAAFSKDDVVAREATGAIFREIVEPWADSFEPDLAVRYVAFMSEAVFAPGSPIVSALGDLGLRTPAELRRRYERVRRCPFGPSYDLDAVRSVVVLSRVTLGADIAVTGTVIDSVRRLCPGAVVSFVGPGKNADLLASGRGIASKIISYDRESTLGSRLAAWPVVRELVSECIAGLPSQEWIVLDPDSRLTQLGLLPVAPDEAYYHFESRSAPVDNPAPLSALAAQWSLGSRVLPELDVGDHQPAKRAAVNGKSKAMAGQPVLASREPVAAVSFGVGGRESKRLGGRFEDDLLELLRQEGYRIILDYGAGDDEERLTDERVVGFAGSVGTLHEFADWPKGPANLSTWKGSLPGFGRWVAEADVFIGYDSAAAHLAAALAVPVIEVFAGAPSALMRKRWTPSGKGPTWVIPADGPSDAPAVLARITRHLSDARQLVESEGS